VREVTDAELGRDDRRGEFHRVADNEVRTKFGRDREQIGQHPRRANPTEQPRTHHRRPLRRFQGTHLGIGEHDGHRLALAHPGGDRTEPDLTKAIGTVGGGRPQHGIAVRGERHRQRHHPVNVTPPRRRREQHSHAREHTDGPTRPDPVRSEPPQQPADHDSVRIHLRVLAPAMLVRWRNSLHRTNQAITGWRSSLRSGADEG
jgi:hypothetical protein